MRRERPSVAAIGSRRTILRLAAIVRDGSAVTEHGITGIHALKARLFTDKQMQHMLDKIASWRFQSDWGTRGIAIGEPGFNPVGYVHGSVSGLRTAEVAQAFCTGHRPVTAFEIWRELVSWFSLDSLGHMHEVLRGEVYASQSESVPEQTWSSPGFLSAAVHGLFGLEASAEWHSCSCAASSGELGPCHSSKCAHPRFISCVYFPAIP